MADEIGPLPGVMHATVSRYDAESHIPAARDLSRRRLRKLPMACACHWRATTSRRGCFAPAAPPGWTATTMPRVLRRRARPNSASVRRSESRSSSTAAFGARPSSARRHPSRCPPTPKRASRDFADLVATAIANAATRAELIASRARIVAAADDARRRLERDLHDGAQQRLVALGLELRAAEACVPPELPPLKEQLSDSCPD